MEKQKGDLMKKNRLLLTFLTILLAVSLRICPIQAAGTDSSTLAETSALTVSTEEELAEALDAAEADPSDQPVTIMLSNDISCSSTLTLKTGTSVKIDGNGYTVTMSEDNQASADNPNAAMFHMPSSDSADTFLFLENITLNGNNKSRILYVGTHCTAEIGPDVTLSRGKASSSLAIQYGGQCIYNAGTVKFAGTMEKSYNGAYGDILNQGTFTMEKGSLIQDVLTSMGGAVYNDINGIFYMQESSILNASGSRAHGAAISNFGTFHMDNCTVSGCISSVSAIYNNGIFTMDHCTISGNKNTSVLYLGQSGGTVYQQDGTFTMTDSSVSENRACTGAGIFVNGGAFIMDGADSAIADNICLYEIVSSTNVKNFGNGGGVFINNGIFTMKDGIISENSATYTLQTDETDLFGKTIDFSGNGGAVLINGGTCNIEGGSICSNHALNAETSGIYLCHGRIGDSARDPSALQLSGKASIEDPIYLTYGYAIELTDKPEGHVYRIIQENTNVGAPAAVCRALSAGETEFLTEEDASLFLSENTSKSYELDAESRQIVLAKQDLSECTISLLKTEYTYTGKTLLPELLVTDPEGNEITEYNLVCRNNVDAGTATAYLTGDSYTTIGAASITYTIIPYTLTEKSVTISPSVYQYTGSRITPSITVMNGKTVLTEAASPASTGDYTVALNNNINTGTAAAVITGCGNYTGVITKTFKIKDTQSITGTSSYTKAYGSGSFTLNAKLSRGDGKLTYSSSNTKIAKVSSTGKVTLTGTGTVKITVKAAETDHYLSAQKIITIKVGKGTQKFTGSTVYNKTYGNAAFTLNTKLSAGNGKLTWKSANTGIVTVSTTGKITIKGCGRTTITITAAETSLYKKASRTVTITVKPKKASITSLKSTVSKKMTLAWKKDTKATGYQICYSTGKNFTSGVKTVLITKNSTTSKTITGLTGGKTYYVRIRSYKLVNGKALYGDYSTAKTIKVKKS